MLRKLAIAIAASGAMISASYVNALGMGDIELESALNQPLNAHIKLIKASELENWEIKPDLASADEFQKSGIEHVFFLNNLKFEVERVGEDVFIKLSTNQPVVEPFLNFLVQVDWPNGRLLREYTLLLDPPVFSEDLAEPVSAPELEDEFESEMDAADTVLPGMGVADDLADIPDVVDDSIDMVDEPEEELVEDSDISDLADVEDETLEPELDSTEQLEDDTLSEPLAVEETQAPQTYTVRDDDTLWEVALRTRPNRSITPQQAMLAIQDLNPDAFIGGNINRLKKNQVLRLPAEEQMRDRSFNESVSEVAFQNQFLTQRKAQLDATRKSQVIEREEEVAGAELKLLAGGAATADAQRSASGEVMAQTAGDQSKLDNELSLALEDLDKSKRANVELGARLDLLEEQIKTLQRIISLKDEQMVALQAGFAKSGEATKADPRQAELDQLSAAAKASEQAKSKADLNFAKPEEKSGEPKALATEKAAAIAKAKPEADKKPKAKFTPLPEVVEDEPFDVVEFAMENPPVLGGILGALLLSLLGVNYARKRKEKLEEESVADMSAFDGVDPLEPMDSQIENDFDDEFADLEIGSGDDLADDELVTRLDEFGEADSGVSDELDASDHENTDVLGEVEIYIAYDRFDQARSLLEKTLESQPARMDVRIKLMEVLSSMGDQGAVAQHYDYVVAQGSEDDQAKASQFRDAAGEAGVTQGEHDFDADGGLDLEISNDTGDMDELEFSAGELDDGDLNFDLDGLGLDDEPSQNVETLELNDSDSENTLDFESNLEDEVSLDLGVEEESSADDLSMSDLDFNEEPELNGLEFDLGVEEQSAESLDSSLDFDIPELNDDLSDSDELESLAESAGGLDDIDLSLDGDDSLEFSSDALDIDLGLESGDELSLDVEESDLPVLEDSNDLDIDLDLSGGVSLELDDSLSLDSELDGVAQESLDGDLGDLDLDSLDVELDAAADLSFDVEDDELPILDDSAEIDLDAVAHEDDASDEVSLDLDMDLNLDDLAEQPQTDTDPLLDLDELSKELDAEMLEFDASEPVNEPISEPVADSAELDLSDLDADLDFLSGTDESETKLDLARAYIDMDDKDGAKEILQEVLEEGTDKQKHDAGSLLDSLV